MAKNKTVWNDALGKFEVVEVKTSGSGENDYHEGKTSAGYFEDTEIDKILNKFGFKADPELTGKSLHIAKAKAFTGLVQRAVKYYVENYKPAPPVKK